MVNAHFGTLEFFHKSGMPDAGCLSLSNNINHSQQVSVLGGFTCCMKSKHQEGPAHQTSPS